MSKASELRALKYGRSVDAPINFRHRTGDSEGESGNMLDLYAQEKSVEDVIFESEDDLAKARFLKGFSGYLCKVFSKTEREFLRRLMSGQEKLQDVGRAMGVDWFKYMQSLQRKAYKKITPLLRLVELTGWSRAEEFTAAILRRLSLLDDGAVLEDIIPKVGNRAKVRESLKAAKGENGAEEESRLYYAKQKRLECNRRSDKKWRNAHKEEIKAYKEQHKEEIREYMKKYREANREKLSEYQKEYNQRNPKKRNEAKKRYREKNREAIRARIKAWKKANREKVLADKKAYRERKKAEREAAKLDAAAAQV